MALYDDRTGEQGEGPRESPLLREAQPRPRVRDEQLVMAPASPIRTEYLPEELFVQLQDGEGRLLFDAEGRPVMVRHLLQKPCTAVNGIYLILSIMIAVVLVNVVLMVIGLVELRSLGGTF